jgi:hypothetical protein
MKHLKLFTIFFIIAIATNQITCKFNLNKILEKYRLLFAKRPISESNSKILKFSYQNCGPNSDPFQVNTLQITPDPLKLPGDVYLTGEANVKQNITGPLTMTLKIIKIIGPVKFEIPCVDNFGSCTYPGICFILILLYLNIVVYKLFYLKFQDVCAMLPPSDQCPPFFKEYNIPWY